MSFKMTVRVLHSAVSIYSPHAVVATTKTIAAIVKRALKAGVPDVIVKTDHGCPCETEKLAAALRRNETFAFVRTKGSTIEIDLARRVKRRRIA
jgi:hypothetical protein